MVPALGRALILLALFAASAGALVGFVTGARPSALGWRVTRRLAYAFAAFMTAANLLMVYALLARDFTVSYVTQVGSRAVPDWVAVDEPLVLARGLDPLLGPRDGRLHRGGALTTSGDRHPEYMPYATAVWLCCAAFFSFLIAGPAQPFLTVPHPPADGPGPNALLQNHILMMIHPPFLYGGYVGLTIPFGLAAAALLVGRLGHDFIRPLRTLPAPALDLPHHRHRPRRLVGLRGPGLGRLLGVGPGGERVLPALAHRHRRPALRAARGAQGDPEGLDR